jgi:hypothetical protein
MAQQEKVTFYAWVERSPSSMTMRISGGQRAKDANSGAIMAMAHKEIRFNMGMLHTDDPETIRELRKLASKPDSGVTEDYDLYLSKVEPPKRREERMAKRNLALASTVAQKDEEIAELKKKLAGKG